MLNTERARTFQSVTRALACACVLVATSGPARAGQSTITELEARVTELTRQLEQANAELAAARELEVGVTTAVASTESAAAPPSNDIVLGPVTIGGAVRVNYVYGDYASAGGAPQRGANGGDVELDTFRINAALEHGQWLGKFEYRWYEGYNFLHTGWLGYAFSDAAHVEVGMTRVPFGPGPYGVSQSWFFDQHYYLGLADDMDVGVKYVLRHDNWDLDLAWFASSEGNWNGASEDSARYSYDAVHWTSTVAANGDVVPAAVNGYAERNQFNLRARRQWRGDAITADAGVSAQWGQLDGKRASDGHHWAVSAHMINTLGDFTLASQLTRYGFSVEDANGLIALGAYDFAWPVASHAWIPAVSLSYRIDTPGIAWLDYVLPYLEYSSVVKDDDAFNDSQLWMLGAAWASGGWYIYSDLAYSNGNLFVGDEGDDYGNVFAGVGDFGANGNDRWNYRLNLNFGYYY